MFPSSSSPLLCHHCRVDVLCHILLQRRVAPTSYAGPTYHSSGTRNIIINIEQDEQITRVYCTYSCCCFGLTYIGDTTNKKATAYIKCRDFQTVGNFALANSRKIYMPLLSVQLLKYWQFRRSINITAKRCCHHI